jgi:hypothetical protein
MDCDPMTFTATQHVDDFFWDSENLTSLCTQACATDLASWISSVNKSCANQTIPVGGMRVLASYLPSVYLHGFEIACLKSRYDQR